MKFQEFFLISNQQTWSGNATKKFGTFEDTAMLVSLIASTALALAVTTHGPHVVSEGQYTMKSWTLTESDFTIELEVPSSAKWVGFGIGEDGAGAMGGADIVVCETPNGKWTCTDSYALGEMKPVADVRIMPGTIAPAPCEMWLAVAQQDWTLLSADTSGDATLLTLKRATDTGDAGQDRVILHNHPLPQLLIFAMGTSSSI
eukprot:gene22837-26904_t